MSQREDLNKLLGNIDELTRTHPETSEYLKALMRQLKPQIEQLLTEHERKDTQVHTGRE